MVAQDEDLARVYLERERARESLASLGVVQDDDAEQRGPSRASYSPESARLDKVADLVQSLIHVTVKLKGSNPGTFKPSPRPVSALERLRAEERRQAINDLADLLVPREE